MRFSSLLWLAPLAAFVAAQDTDLRAVKQAFDAANIPRNLNIKFDPSVLLEVTFPEGDRSITLHAGIQLPRNATAGPPTFSIAGDAPSGPFVIATVDPDAPTPQAPTNAQIRHFLGGNFIDRELNEVTRLVNVTPAISEFRQPTPPAGSDPHRYIFLLFNQPRGFDDQAFVTASTPINLFNISLFAREVGLGDPIGGTFMLVGPDPTTA